MEDARLSVPSAPGSHPDLWRGRQVSLEADMNWGLVQDPLKQKQSTGVHRALLLSPNTICCVPEMRNPFFSKHTLFG